MINTVFLTQSETLSLFIGSAKANFIGADIRRKAEEANQGISVSSLLIKSGDLSGFNEYCEYVMRRSDVNVILFCESGLVDLVSRFSNSFFIVETENYNSEMNIQNYLRKITAKAIKLFLFYLEIHSEEKGRRLLNLPTRNFDAPEMQRLIDLFAIVDVDGDFKSALEALLGLLRERQRPKRSKDANKEIFVVDDGPKFFIYGLERHARPDDASPPHDMRCRTDAHFRFGGRFDERRHFNVSRETGTIGGELQNCHDGTTAFAAATHLNVFPNDFA